MEKTHSKNIHIGNQGEHIVAAKLSAHCIVRDVGQGKDTGIDLYCEILNDKTLELSLHFFCQVKTVKRRFNQNKIKEIHFKYWSNQPVPVFLIVVKYKEEENIHSDHEIWVYDIPYILTKKDAKDFGRKEPPRDVDDIFKLGSESNNKDKMSLQDFLYGHVPWTYGLWQMRRFGLVLPNPEIKKQKEQYGVGGFTYLYKEKIEKAVNYAQSLLEKEQSNH